jgi:hypothetical protein
MEKPVPSTFMDQLSVYREQLAELTHIGFEDTTIHHHKH